MLIIREIRRLLRSLGYDIYRFTPATHPLARRKKLFETFSIDVVLDVGANTGQFGNELRKDIGYTNKILSFEPLSSAFEVLSISAKHDANWEIFNFALGDIEERNEINIAGNSYSSSLLDMLPSHEMSAPDSRYVGREVIEIKMLDSIFDDLCKPGDHIYLKIDTQGFESKVLKGAKKSLERIDTVQLEMSLVPLYKDVLLFTNMCMLMNDMGFSLVAIESGFSDPVSGQLLQVDGIFHRSR